MGWGVYMTEFEKLIAKSQEIGIKVYELETFKGKSGYYFDNTILINKNLSYIEKRCIMMEELGHHFKTHGDISDQKKVENRKQELVARRWAYENLIEIAKLIHTYKNGLKEKFEISEFLDITEDFLEGTLQHYRQKYGTHFEMEKYIIFFEPTITVIDKTELKQSI